MQRARVLAVYLLSTGLQDTPPRVFGLRFTPPGCWGRATRSTWPKALARPWLGGGLPAGFARSAGVGPRYAVGAPTTVRGHRRSWSGAERNLRDCIRDWGLRPPSANTKQPAAPKLGHGDGNGSDPFPTDPPPSFARLATAPGPNPSRGAAQARGRPHGRSCGACAALATFQHIPRNDDCAERKATGRNSQFRCAGKNAYPPRWIRRSRIP